MKVSLKISVLLFLLAYAGPSTTATANKSHNRYDACDESMCVSSGDSSKDDAQKNASTGFDCYSDVVHDPMICSSGYFPKIIYAEPPILSPENITYNYYTCCPPTVNSTSLSSSSYSTINSTGIETASNTTLVRHCNDPIVKGIVTDEMTCSNDNDNDNATNTTIRKYPREMEKNNRILLYMCCDTEPDNISASTIEYLKQAECIYTTTSVRKNSYGGIDAMTCINDFGIYWNEFAYPKVTETINSEGYVYFECCKEGPGKHFIQDTAFMLTIWPQIIVSSISIVLSFLLVIALIVPLWLYLKQQNTAAAAATTAGGGGGGATTRSHNRGTRQSDVSYSGYNLYLVYLTIPDLILNGYLLCMYGLTAGDLYNENGAISGTLHIIKNAPKSSLGHASALVLGCTTANMFMNSVVAYEVLKLLKDSHQRKRHKPPSLKRVSCKAAIVYIYAIVVYIGRYCASNFALKNFAEEPSTATITFDFAISLIISTGIPLFYITYACVIIWWKNLMPNMSGRLRELVLFFFRIIVVFFVFWLPGMSLVITAQIGDYDPHRPSRGYCAAIGLVIIGAQASVSFFMALTKSDVKTYVLKLITGSYCRKQCCNRQDQDQDQDHNHNQDQDCNQPVEDASVELNA